MTSEAITIARADLTTEVSRALIGALNDELRGVYPEPGANHFNLDPEEVTGGRGMFLVVYRGTGLGRRLVTALETKAGHWVFDDSCWRPGCEQTAALALYRTAGFRSIPFFGEYRCSPATSVCLGKELLGPDP